MGSRASLAVRTVRVAFTVALCGAPLAAQAAGTPAGTPVTNTATVSYSIGGTAATTTSNTTTVTVAEVLDTTVVLQSATVQVAAGDTQRGLVFRVTNVGNGPESFRLVLDPVLAGDDFDPVPSTPSIYFDTDGSGDFSPGDVAYAPGTNDPLLAADAGVTVIVLNDIPPAVVNGQRGRAALQAAALTGVGAPGLVYAGQGEGGVDAVVGARGADDEVTGEYLVADIALSAVKSQVVSDPFGGASAVPGATIAYQVIVTAIGTGTAVGALFNDDVPAGTTYVPGSLARNAAALTDAADGDAGSFVAAPTPQVSVDLGNLTAADGPQTLSFRVTIN